MNSVTLITNAVTAFIDVGAGPSRAKSSPITSAAKLPHIHPFARQRWRPAISKMAGIRLAPMIQAIALPRGLSAALTLTMLPIVMRAACNKLAMAPHLAARSALARFGNHSVHVAISEVPQCCSTGKGLITGQGEKMERPLSTPKRARLQIGLSNIIRLCQPASRLIHLVDKGGRCPACRRRHGRVAGRVRHAARSKWGMHRAELS